MNIQHIAYAGLAPGIAAAGIGTGIAMHRALEPKQETVGTPSDALVFTAATMIGTMGTAVGAATLFAPGMQAPARIGGAILASIGVGAFAGVASQIQRGE